MREYKGVDFLNDVTISEKEKSAFEYLRSNVDHHINTLITDKSHIRTARNLYAGKRDAEEFKFLEESFGVETPIAVRMTSLIKPRIDILLGILLSEEFTFSTSIKDGKSLDHDNESKKILLINSVVKSVNNSLAAKIGKSGEPNKTAALNLEKLEADNDKAFVSIITEAADTLIKFFSTDPGINHVQSKKLFMLDLLLAGEAYYKTEVIRKGSDPVRTVIKPENYFTNKVNSAQFMSTGIKPNATAGVERVIMTATEIINLWGVYLTDEDKEGLYRTGNNGAAANFNHEYLNPANYEAGNNFEHLGMDGFNNKYKENTHVVYITEWLANNELTVEDPEIYTNTEEITMTKEEVTLFGKGAGSGIPKKVYYRLDRYKGIRIGEDLYVNMGKDLHAPRGVENPWVTTLSVNGLFYNDRSGDPYSVALSIKDIQDSYDITMFFRDNLVANTGVSGSRIDLAALPKMFGPKFSDRMIKFINYRKQGMEFYDSSEEGMANMQPLGNFESSLGSNVITQIALILESLEKQADMVTGINRSMYTAAEQRDAVSNVKIGQENVMLITKDLFTLVKSIEAAMLTDLLNSARVAYVTGKRGQYILGDRQKYFEILPENFRFTDFVINPVDDSRDKNRIASLKAAVPNLIQSGLIESDVLVKVIMEDSPTAVINMIEASAERLRLLNDKTGQLSQEAEQAKEQAKTTAQELAALSAKYDLVIKERDGYRSRELDIKEKLVDGKIQALKDKTDLTQQEIDNDEAKTEALLKLEEEQMNKGSGKAAEIRNDL